MQLPSVRSFETRLEKAGTPDALRRLAAELDDIRHHQFGQREQALVAKAAEDGLTWADIVPAISAAPFWRTSHRMIEAAAVAGKLASLDDVSQAVDLIHPQGEVAEPAMSAVRDAAKPFLEITDQTSADDLEVIVRVAHEIMVSSVQHSLIAEEAAKRALDFCPTAELAAAFTEKLGCCWTTANRLLQLSADKLASEDTLDVASALQLLGAVHTDEVEDLSAVRTKRHILDLLAPKLEALEPTLWDLIELAGFVVDPEKPDDPRRAEKAIIKLMVEGYTHSPRLALDAALSFNTPTGFHGVLTKFVRQRGVPNEEAAMLFTLVCSKDSPGSDELKTAVAEACRTAGYTFSPLVFMARLAQLRRARPRRTVTVFGGKGMSPEEVAQAQELGQAIARLIKAE